MLPAENRVKRTKTPEQALAALMRLCARAEKSTGDAMRLLRTWNVEQAARPEIVARLVEQRFIDDVRFAEAFVREKVRLSGWGAYKIRTALRGKGITAEVIEQALSQFGRDDMTARLTEQLQRKTRILKTSTLYELKTKLLRYGLSLGYDFEAVKDVLATLLKDTDECDDSLY